MVKVDKKYALRRIRTVEEIRNKTGIGWYLSYNIEENKIIFVDDLYSSKIFMTEDEIMKEMELLSHQFPNINNILSPTLVIGSPDEELITNNG